MMSCISRTLRTANRYLEVLLDNAELETLASSHGDILEQLFKHEPITMQDLAASIHRDPSTVTALVKKLMKAEYVTTCKSPQDRRMTEVRLTAKGRKLETKFKEISASLAETLTHGIPKACLETTCKTLNQIEANFSQASTKDQQEKQGSRRKR